MDFPEHVRTPRLDLRRWRETDRKAFTWIWADPVVWRALRGDRRFDPRFAAQRFEHHLRHWDRHGFGLWAIKDRASGSVAGWVGPAHPTSVPELARDVEIGWTLRRPFWSRGLAFEAAEAAVEAAFARLKIEGVISVIHPTNTRSISVAKRLGMHDTGRIHHTNDGDPIRVYALSRAKQTGGLN